MKINEVTKPKVEMCPEACCGKPVTECSCGPDCKHCDCYAKNNVNESDINEALPLAAAAVWIIRWAATKAAWPILKWVLKKHGGKLAVGATAAAAIDQGWDWVISQVGPEAAKMLVDNKFEIGMAVALIIGAVAFKRFFEKKGESLVAKYQESMYETTSAGAIAGVAGPVGGLISRQMKNADGTVKNALDMSVNVMGMKKKNTRTKKT